MTTVTKETFWTQIVEDPTLYGTITTEDNLFNYRSDAVWQVMNETFIANGTNFEVTKWEELLGLNVTETTLNGRKEAILNHITENLPITIGILEQLIKEITNDNYLLEYDEKENKLFLSITEETENDIKDLIPRVIPVISDVAYNYNLLPKGYLAAEFVEKSVVDGQYTSFPDYYGENKGLKMTATLYNLASTTEVVGTPYSSDGYFSHPTNSYYFLSYFGKNYYTSIDLGEKYVVEINWKNDGMVRKRANTFYEAALAPSKEVWGGRITSGKNAQVKIYDLQLSEGSNVVRNYIPALTPQGGIVLYDTVQKQEVGYKCDVIGFTLPQALKLADLPDGGGTLTVSLPTGYDTDAGVIAALETARGNGWTLTIQTYTPEESTSTASTFGMRRIWVRKTQDENGTYVDANGNRFQVEWCVEIYSPENKTPEDLGYEQFRSVESAVQYWELTHYVDPTLEEQFNIINEEQ